MKDTLGRAGQRRESGHRKKRFGFVPERAKREKSAEAPQPAGGPMKVEVRAQAGRVLGRKSADQTAKPASAEYWRKVGEAMGETVARAEPAAARTREVAPPSAEVPGGPGVSLVAKLREGEVWVRGQIPIDPEFSRRMGTYLRDQFERREAGLPYETVVKSVDHPVEIGKLKNKNRKDEGLLNEWLAKYFEEINLPRSLWTKTAAEIGRVVRKQRIAATERPQWDDRAKYPELADLSAPQFLKRVWADQFNADGSIARELVTDKKLLRIVGVYMDNRQSRGLDLGDAEGLRLIRGKTGRPPRPGFR